MAKTILSLWTLLAFTGASVWAQQLTAVSGGGQRTVISTAFPEPFVAIVTDGNGNPLSGYTVTFSGPGLDTSYNYSVQTGANGLASATLYANATAQAFTVTASINTATMTSFSARQGTQTNCSSTISVTSANDSGAGTLRNAIDEVCNGGTIDLSGLGSATISLASRLYLGSDMTLQGSSASPVTIDGGSATRIFFVESGNITLTNMILAHGDAAGYNGGWGGASAGMGGAIFQNGGNLSLSNVALTSNSAQGGSCTNLSSFAGAGIGGPPDPSTGNGGSGGDLGGSGGIYFDYDPSNLSGGDGAGGGTGSYYCGGCSSGGNGGFGGGAGGGAYAATPGFGGGGAAGTSSYSDGGWGGNKPTAAGGGAGGGLGGAIFLRRGLLNLSTVSFTGNQTQGGHSYTNPIYVSYPGQGKGGALFIYYGAFVNASGVTYSSNVAPDAGVGSYGQSSAPYTYNTTCPGVDTQDVCGAITAANTLSVSVTGAGTGTVSSGPVGFNTIYCPGLCSMNGNGSVTLTPAAAPGSQFDSWSGACTGSGSCVVSLASSNQSVTANFVGNYATTIAAANAQTMYSPSSQNVNLSATVSSSNGTVNAGTVTFTVAGLGSVTSGTVAGGTASASFTIPGGLVATSYAITAVYNAGGLFTTSSDATHSLTIAPAIPQLSWSQPADIVYGSALGSGELDATANTAGSFAYTPAAGTVLAVGNGQTLSVSFTPSDHTNYQPGPFTTTTTINVAPAVTQSPVNLIVTRSLARFTDSVVVTLTIANNGGTAANNVTLTEVQIGSTAGALPPSLGQIAAGASAQATVTFPGSAGATGAASSLTVAGTYTGGSFRSSSRITLP